METEVMKEQIILDMIKEKRKIWKKGSGRNLLASIKPELEKHSISIGRDKFFDLLRENDLLIKKTKRKTNTTFSYHHFHKYPNLIKEKEATYPGQIIVSDITYIWLSENDSFAYLYLITDVYSRKIIGYYISDNLKASSAVKALKKALKYLPRIKAIIHHSDRGIQYCSYEYTDLLKLNNISISMTEDSDPRDNAIAERINRTIKEEFTDDKTISFKNLNQAKNNIPKIINFYNEQRPHRSIEMLTPDVAFTMNRELKRYWKSYYPQKITKCENEILVN